jgi:hypothetical protein
MVFSHILHYQSMHITYISTFKWMKPQSLLPHHPHVSWDKAYYYCYRITLNPKPYFVIMLIADQNKTTMDAWRKPCHIMFSCLSQSASFFLLIGKISPKSEFQNSKIKWFCTFLVAKGEGEKKTFYKLQKLYLLESKETCTSKAQLWLLLIIYYTKPMILISCFTQCGFYVFPSWLCVCGYKQKSFIIYSRSFHKL